MLFRVFNRQSDAESITRTRESITVAAAPYKTYGRFPMTALPAPHLPDEPFGELLAARRSVREFDQSAALTLQDISDLLHASFGINPDRDGRARLFPSGGQRYPLECYIAAFRVESLATALYHYEVRAHALAELVAMPHPSLMLDATDLSPDKTPAAIFIMTSVWDRSYPTYGEYAYRLAIAEAGHAMQNLLLAATASEINACPAMGFKTDIVAKAIGIEHDEEDPLYLALIG